MGWGKVIFSLRVSVHTSRGVTGGGYPILKRPSSIESTCYAAGGMPLVFTQEDFLVLEMLIIMSSRKLKTYVTIFAE